MRTNLLQTVFKIFNHYSMKDSSKAIVVQVGFHLLESLTTVCRVDHVTVLFGLASVTLTSYSSFRSKPPQVASSHLPSLTTTLLQGTKQADYGRTSFLLTYLGFI